jgi:non-heme chloroperoxidase
MAKGMNARLLTAEESDWFVRQSMLSPTYAVLLLRADMLLSDYRAEAKQLDGKLPVLNVISEPSLDKAMPWIKANTPNSATFTIKRHMSFWSEPEGFNAGLDAFLAGLK